MTAFCVLFPYIWFHGVFMWDCVRFATLPMMNYEGTYSNWTYSILIHYVLKNLKMYFLAKRSVKKTWEIFSVTLISLTRNSFNSHSIVTSSNNVSIKTIITEWLIISKQSILFIFVSSSTLSVNMDEKSLSR